MLMHIHTCVYIYIDMDTPSVALSIRGCGSVRSSSRGSPGVLPAGGNLKPVSATLSITRRESSQHSGSSGALVL